MPQGMFLESMGMNVRLQVLQKNSPSKAKELENDYLRLVHPDKMGEIYKILYIGHEEIGNICSVYKHL